MSALMELADLTAGSDGKECRRCRLLKTLDEFASDRTQPDGRNTWCRQCVSERRLERLAAETPEQVEQRRKRWREARAARRSAYSLTCACCGNAFESRHRRRIYCSIACKRRGTPAKQQRVLQAARDQHAAIRAWLEEYKCGHGCVDCGYNAHAEALQFDHEGEKSAAISQLRSSIPRMLEEIERGRCVVRCANCHAVKTRERKLARAAS